MSVASATMLSVTGPSLTLFAVMWTSLKCLAATWVRNGNPLMVTSGLGRESLALHLLGGLVLGVGDRDPVEHDEEHQQHEQGGQDDPGPPAAAPRAFRYGKLHSRAASHGSRHPPFVRP